MADATIDLDGKHFVPKTDVSYLRGKSFRLWVKDPKILSAVYRLKINKSGLHFIIATVPVVVKGTARIAGRFVMEETLKEATVHTLKPDMLTQLQGDAEYELYHKDFYYAALDFVLVTDQVPSTLVLRLSVGTPNVEFKVQELGPVDSIFHVDELLWHPLNTPIKMLSATLNQLPYEGFPQIGVAGDEKNDRLKFLYWFDASGAKKNKFRFPSLEALGERIVVPGFGGGEYTNEDLDYSRYFGGRCDFGFDEVLGGFVANTRYGFNDMTGIQTNAMLLPDSTPVLIYNITRNTYVFYKTLLGPVCRKGPSRSRLL